MDRSYTILFVEDDSGVRGSTVEVLASRGFRMLVARDGYEAMQLLAENHVDVLFTDIVMPGIDGIALAKEAIRLNPDLKVMFMTGYYSRAMEAVQIGRLLFKPLRGDEIEQNLRELLRPEADPTA
jgi:DNA-binding NtrC family response regulator